MAVSKEGDAAKAIWAFDLMTRFVRKLDARHASRAAPLENVKTIITSSSYCDGGELRQCGSVALGQALPGRTTTGIWHRAACPAQHD
jgi:hypothetical protein